MLHTILTFIPRNEFYKAGNRRYYAVNANTINSLVADVAEVCEDATLKGYMLWHNETFEIEEEFTDTWQMLNADENFKPLYDYLTRWGESPTTTQQQS